MRPQARPFALSILIFALLAGCSSSSNPSPAPTTPAKYQVGGTVAGLAPGASIVLRNNATDDLTIGANGPFTFATSLADGSPYAVTLVANPPGQECTVAQGAGVVAGANVSNVAVSCAEARFAIGGSVSGLPAEATITLRNNGGDDLSTPNGTFTFATPLARGATYDVAVAAAPAGYSCAVADGSGTVASGDVTNVAVTCSHERYTVGGTVSGLPTAGTITLRNNGGDEIAVGNGPFSFPTSLVQGSSYDVTIVTPPSGKTCVVNGGAGVIALANVTNVAVTCGDTLYSIGGTISGLTSSGLVLHSTVGGEDLTVAANATTFTFTTRAPAGTPYAVSVKTQPATVTCSVTSGATGAVASSNVTSIAVACTPLALSWSAPATWGGLWPASSTMVQHAYFDGTRIVEVGGTGITWNVEGGAEPPQRALGAFPAGTRHGAGPFEGQRYQATAGSDAAVQALTGDMIACVVFKPDYNPITDDYERPILARGVGHGNSNNPGGGWVLMQMHSHFCFHYEYMLNGATNMEMATIPTRFADQNVTPGNGPLNPSVVVFCGGRNGNTIYSAVSGTARGFTESTVNLGAGAGELDAGVHPTTIGGYDASALDAANHRFGGRVYETAIWREPATRANVAAKLAAIQGLGQGETYWRNREAWFKGQDGGDHAVWWDAPRIDVGGKGFLFGLQSWNRLSSYEVAASGLYPVKAPGEDMSLWTPGAGASVSAATAVEPPGDSERASAKIVTLDPGASLTTPLAAFDTDGPIHGQIWLRLPVATTGTLRVQNSAPRTADTGSFDIDLSQIQANTWTRIWLRRGDGGPGNQLTTDGNAGTLSLVAPASNPAPISFFAWGVHMTQIGTLPTANGGSGGVDLGAFDPGQAFYDWSASVAANATQVVYPVDVLQLPPVPVSTASTGFCMKVTASMPDGLPWNAPFTRPRVAAAWVNDPSVDPPSASVLIYLDGARTTTFTPNGGGKLCARFWDGAPIGGRPGVCADIPSSFTPGSTHTLTACMSPSGQTQLFADGSTTPLVSGSVGVPAPDLQGGSLLLGGARTVSIFVSSPWHGYVSRAVICRSTNPAACP